MSVYTTGKAWISVVDLQAGKVIRYIHTSPGYPFDLAVSPDGTQLFVASHTTRIGVNADTSDERPDTSGVPISTCPLSNGICVFDTTTFALTGHVFGLTGYLAVSQDGKSLYCWSNNPINPTLPILDIGSLSVSAITIPQGQFVGSVTVAPTGNQAVILALVEGVPSAYVLNTESNEITGSFPPPPVSGFFSFTSNVAAFSRDGTSIWTLGACTSVVVCMAVAGQSFPSGATIAQVPVTQPSGVLAVTF
jgi:DNA-binding beta-propeller fold protein YncE